MPSNSPVSALRYGYTTFIDDCVPVDFDPSTLGFSQGYVKRSRQNDLPEVPRLRRDGYGLTARCSATARPCRSLYSQDANASLSKLMGRHTFKFGPTTARSGWTSPPSADRRRVPLHGGIHGRSRPELAPPAPATRSPASCSASRPAATSRSPTKAEIFIDYYAGYAQDDFRVNKKLTVNVGLRYEYEQGLQENDNFVVGFDPTAGRSRCPAP